jgi:hypothetical protein
MSSSLTEVAHRFGSQVAVLAPPYRASSALKSLGASNDLSLGSVVLGKGDTTIAVLAELTAVVYRWPWVVPCLTMPIKEEPLEPLLLLVTELRDRLAVAKRSSLSGTDELINVIAAVRRRALPTAQVLAEWIARRLHRAELETPLRSQFREALEGIPASASLSVSTYSRLFAQYGEYTARDWRALARLCGHAAQGAQSMHWTPPTLALRTASYYTKRYLAIPYHVLAERVGWEWILERALRTGRYL